MNTVLLLPVHQPGDQFVRLLDDMMPGTPHPARVVVVDDGSGPAADAALAKAQAHGCTVLRRPVNRGKGVVLKAGFQHAMTAHPGLDVVTADGDGQHSASDIAALTARAGQGRLVLGVRQFDRMPPRSRLGNHVVQRLFQAVTGRSISDTQTGLRSYPAQLLDRLCQVPGDRFDYEMNALLAAVAAGYEFDEVPIATTYHDNNAGSNFRGLSDSARVLTTLVRHVGLRPAAHLRSR